MIKPSAETSAAAMERPANRQEPRRLKTRAALIQAGADLLALRPIDAIPVNDIVEAAGVAKGSFFNHFEDKDEFAAAIAAEIRADVETRVTQANAGVADPAERVARAVSGFVQFALTEPRRARIMLRGHAGSATGGHPLNQGVRTDVAHGVASGRFRPAAGVAGVALVVGAGQMILAALAKDAIDTDAARRLTASALVLILTGLGVPEADAQAIASSAVSEVIVGAEQGPACYVP